MSRVFEGNSNNDSSTNINMEHLYNNAHSFNTDNTNCYKLNKNALNHNTDAFNTNAYNTNSNHHNVNINLLIHAPTTTSFLNSIRSLTRIQPPHAPNDDDDDDDDNKPRKTQQPVRRPRSTYKISEHSKYQYGFQFVRNLDRVHELEKKQFDANEEYRVQFQKVQHNFFNINASEQMKFRINNEIKNKIDFLTAKERCELNKLTNYDMIGYWSYKDFNQFVEGLTKYGKNAVDMISMNIDSKTFRQVLNYHVLFWQKYKTLHNWKEMLIGQKYAQYNRKEKSELESFLESELESEGDNDDVDM